MQMLGFSFESFYCFIMKHFFKLKALKKDLGKQWIGGLEKKMCTLLAIFYCLVKKKTICENFEPAAARPHNCFIVDLESHPAVILLLRDKFFSIYLRNYSIRSRNRGEKVGEKHQDKIF